MAAAFMLGAVGVQMGTRFLAAYECNIHPTYKEKILKAKDIDTMVTGKRLGHPVRSLKTSFARDYIKKEYDSTVSDEELEQLGVGVLRLAVQEGAENGCYLSGQIAGMVNKEESAADIVKDVCQGAETILKGASQWVK